MPSTSSVSAGSMRTASPIGLSLLAAFAGSAVPLSENSLIALRSLRASTRTPGISISCSQSSPSGGLARAATRGGFGLAGSGAARAPGTSLMSTCDGFECHTRERSAAISSIVRPVVTLFCCVSVGSGPPGRAWVSFSLISSHAFSPSLARPPAPQPDQRKSSGKLLALQDKL